MRQRLQVWLTRPSGFATVFSVALLVGILTSFGLERVRSVDRILRGVSVGGVTLGGLERRAALERLTRLVVEIEQRRIEVSLQKHRIEASARDLGFRADASRLVDAALAEGRTGWKV